MAPPRFLSTTFISMTDCRQGGERPAFTPLCLINHIPQLSCLCLGRAPGGLGTGTPLAAGFGPTNVSVIASVLLESWLVWACSWGPGGWDEVPPELIRMNLLGPLLPLSFPLAVSAVMMLWMSALLGMATTCVLGMVGWLMILIPAGNLQELDSATSWEACAWVGSCWAGGLFASSSDVSPGAFWTGRGSLRLLRISGRRGLVLIMKLCSHSPLRITSTDPAEARRSLLSQIGGVETNWRGSLGWMVTSRSSEAQGEAAWVPVEPSDNKDRTWVCCTLVIPEPTKFKAR